jgi:hypothetical protein
MLEQPETGESRAVAIVSLKLALSQETRASLAAVRVAQESAQRRARRQTRQARIWVALLVGAVALGAGSLRPRLAHWRQSRANTAQPARPMPIATAQAAPPETAAPPAIAIAAAPLAPAPEPSVRSAVAPVVA